MRVVQFGEAQPNELQLLSRRVGGGVGEGARQGGGGRRMLKWGCRE